jgi:hypothetical protein
MKMRQMIRNATILHTDGWPLTRLRLYYLIPRAKKPLSNLGLFGGH